jgi:hypothetical protein
MQMLSTSLRPLQTTRACPGVRVKHARCRSVVLAAKDLEASSGILSRAAHCILWPLPSLSFMLLLPEQVLKTSHGKSMVPAPVEQSTELPEKSRTIVDVLLNRVSALPFMG